MSDNVHPFPTSRATLRETIAGVESADDWYRFHAGPVTWPSFVLSLRFQGIREFRAVLLEDEAGEAAGWEILVKRAEEVPRA